MDTTCSRCARTMEADELIGLGLPLGLMSEHAGVGGRVLLEGHVWARIADQDICPRCLTAGEERELARSYIDLVEAEIARSQAADRDPHPHESALIAYALVLRSRLDPPPPPEGEVT
jgi:hypothetical protein